MTIHSISVEEALELLKTSKNGLSESEVKERQKIYGQNVISGKHKRTIFDIIVDQFKNFILILLLVAAVVAYLIGHSEDAIGIILAVTLSVIFGFILEYKADESMRALQALQAPKATIVRNGKTIVVDAIDLVPGDIIHLEEGEKIPADCRVLAETNIEINESALTGESISVAKNPGKVSENTPLSERTCMLYAGTFVVQGTCTAIVADIGDKTELGKIAAKLSEIESEETVLQKSLDELGKKVSIASVVIIAVFFTIGIIQDRDIADLFILAISLIVAAVPEGLITVLTIILALGVKTMAQNNALVRKLNAVETLGSASIIVVDKTGTLTQGKMALTKIFYSGRILSPSNVKEQSKVLEYASYCNSARITENGLVGDEMDKAILKTSELHGLDIRKIKKLEPVQFYPLDSLRKRMSGLFEISGKKIAIVKGAPELILDSCVSVETNEGIKKLTDYEQKSIHDMIELLGSQGMRLLGLAYKSTNSRKQEDIENGLTFLGIMAFNDPPRNETYDTIEVAKKAGIRVLMLTGDNIKTATAIGKEVGLITHDNEAIEWKNLEKFSDDEIKEKFDVIGIIARATPLSKLKIVELLIEKGEVVAVTGDGVNDALALKKAQVGVVMGSGTDVSKEAGNLVLLDDNIATLISAIKYGRTIFNNIINFIRFQFTTNVAMLTLFFISFFGDLPYLLTPIQILFINIVMDGPPALALGLEKSNSNILNEKPRRSKTIVTRNLVISVLSSAIFMVLVTIGTYLYFKEHSPELALTASFLVFVMMQLFNALNCRSPKNHFYETPDSNPYLFATLVGLFVLLWLIVGNPGLETLFETVSLPLQKWVLIIAAASTILIFEEIKKEFFSDLVHY